MSKSIEELNKEIEILYEDLKVLTDKNKQLSKENKLLRTKLYNNYIDNNTFNSVINEYEIKLNNLKIEYSKIKEMIEKILNHETLLF